MIIKLRVRVLIGIMIFLGYFLIYLVRYNISVHIVEMSQILYRNKRINSHDNSSKIIWRSKTNFQRHKVQGSIKIKDVYWSDTKIARLFSAYYFGYCICFPIFHNWGDRLGPTWIVGIAGLMSGILTCLSPAVAYSSYWLYFVFRIVKGFCAGAMQPSMVQLLRYWVPPMERNHFMWAYCGITTGTFSTFLFCALVHYYSSWPVGFYVFGGIQIIWACLWVFIVCDQPKSHPLISKEELSFLEKTIGTVFTLQSTNSQTPWRLILRSTPFWALCNLNFGYTWMIIALCLHGPLYYSVVAEYSIYFAAVLTALPFLLRLILGTIAIQIFHWYKHKTETTKVRKMRKYIIFFSHVVPGIIVVATWILPIVPGPVFLTIAVTLTAVGMEQTLELCYELTPSFATSVNTVIKIVGNLPGIIISYSVGFLTEKYSNTTHVWKNIWCFHALILFCSGVIFLIFGTTEEQPWITQRERPLRKILFAQPKPSNLSQIIELDEIDSSNRLSTPHSSSAQRASKMKY